MIKINGFEIEPDSAMSGDRYYNIYSNSSDFQTDAGFVSVGEYTLVIKPGVVITSEFFSNNKLEITQVKATSDGPVIIGTFDGVEPEPVIRNAKVISPAEDYFVRGDSVYNKALCMPIEGGNDQRWVNSLRSVTYTYKDANGNDTESQTLKIGSANYSRKDANFSSGNVAIVYDRNTGGFFAAVKYTFTFKAEGYEDTVVTQTVTDLQQIFVVSVEGGEKHRFEYEDLKAIWIAEGKYSYTYSSYNTWPTYETTNFYGPTVKGVLAAADIDVAELDDNDVLFFIGIDDYTGKMTVKDFKEKRYFYPNGATTNTFNGTVESQYVGMSEVPYIVSLNDGVDKYRNIFGQRSPQEEQKSDWNQMLCEIKVYKNAAPEYDGLIPTIESGSEVSAGDRLFFDRETGVWQGGSQYYAGIYYTVSTDGTEPATPTFSDTMYNYKQYGSPSYIANPELFNYYEFTNAPITKIRVIIYARGYTEPVPITLTYYNGITIDSIADQIYDGSAFEPDVTVRCGDLIFEEGTDYTVDYADNINCGNATVTVTGIGRFVGTKTATFRIKMNEEVSAQIDDLRDSSVATVAQLDAVVDKDKYTPASYQRYADAYAAFKAAMLEDNNQDSLKTIREKRKAVTNAYLMLEERTALKDAGAAISGVSASYKYTGKAQTPAVTVKIGNKTLVKGKDYTVSYKNNTNAGTATITITGIGDYKGTITKTFKITKIANTMTAKAAKSSFSFSQSKVKSAAQTVAKPVTVSKAQGTVTYKKTSGNSNITIDSKTGKLTVKKGTKKGTYTIKVQVKAAGNTNYNSKTTTISFKVVVK